MEKLTMKLQRHMVIVLTVWMIPVLLDAVSGFTPASSSLSSSPSLLSWPPSLLLSTTKPTKPSRFTATTTSTTCTATTNADRETATQLLPLMHFLLKTKKRID